MTAAPRLAYRIPSTDPLDVGNAPDSGGPLRAGGEAPRDPILSKGNNPATLSPAAKRQQAALELVRDLWAGAECVRENQTKYLPKMPGEAALNYRNRLARSVFFNIFGHTVIGLTGFIFRRDPKLGDDVPAEIVTDWENLDNAGTHGDVLLREIMQDALIAGHAAIFVDYPNTNGLPISRAEEAVLRPYWIPVKKDDILSWRTTVEDGKLILTQVVLRERGTVPDGLFGEKEHVQYRFLYRRRNIDTGAPVVGFVLYEEGANRTPIEVARGLFGNQQEIPLAEVKTSGRRSLFESVPPLLDLAFLNVQHYQMASDYQNSLHKTCVPIYVESGIDVETNAEGQAIVRVIGPDTGVHFTNPAAKAYYVSHDGAALGACRQALDDLERAMGTLGVAMLAQEKAAAETATAKRIDKSTSDSALAVTARGLQDGAERAMQFHARYRGLDDGGSIDINRDFENLTMLPEMLTAYVNAVANAGLPVRVLLEAMQEGGLLREDADVDALEAEIMANQAAIEEQKRIDQQAKLDAITRGQNPPKALPAKT